MHKFPGVRSSGSCNSQSLIRVVAGASCVPVTRLPYKIKAKLVLPNKTYRNRNKQLGSCGTAR